MPRPMVLNGVTYKAESPTGKVYVTINNDEKGDMFEVFINHGKSGSDLMALADALGRMVSFVLRIHSPVPARERVREIVSELAASAAHDQVVLVRIESDHCLMLSLKSWHDTRNFV